MGYVYILTNKPRGTLYVGVTSELIGRVWQHKQKLVDGFSKKYNLSILVYYEVCDDIEQAIAREKQLKNWHREWKIKLIEEFNPAWKDLFNEINQ
ncbi:MAG: hypothetical protein A3B10_04135 [Candidatus Doudnabacteria bacterium RIFCSPLOWO2_01_FULL_44_21]|uniref:GIY-YIG domain-containing protein n=1 Tax=Candidatus Doudnabacteria bacterium RIFCSPLOWO2_01_FULL_44_21 TaxID=1817841 RepID=A0A1F5Q591_9BACT|nr:MAG: hypothetical protein A3B95_00365 [Candidatus Doudnabacteria bacterium RIFCSPHIGHO2_02_FULL_43_13b]OGE97304.1 MAG: hypothetical protein A3B10_04135 [Candidatus Doudnabacteria bacterium RIFCSPLOWO2_01_FULL_44_21]